MAPRKRPCRICRRWFEPHPRAGDRQRVCSDEACQAERHRRSDKAWRARNPDYDKKRRVAKKLGDVVEGDAVATPYDDPLEEVDWPALERVIGPAHRVVTEGTSRLLVNWAQDAVRANVQAQRRHLDRLTQGRAQDAVPSRDTEQPPDPIQVPTTTRKTQSDRGPPPH